MKEETSAGAALGERIKIREEIRDQRRLGLLEYARMVKPGYRTPKHICEMAEALEALERGDIKNLGLVIPVRHGKSELGSQIFPGWYIGRNPSHQIIHASYASSLVTNFGRRVRNIVAGERHAQAFPQGARLALDSKSANRWHTKEGGVYIAAGVGGGITGFGMHLGIIDDPHAGGQEAVSETYRERAWDWYQSDFLTRQIADSESGFEPRLLVIGSRWHEDDLLGRIFENERGDWHVIHRPALDDFGRALWPERYSAEFLRKKRDRVGPRNWQALYQGRPAPEEGAFFKRANIHRAQRPEMSMLKMYGASDYAVTDGAGDWTVHLVIGLDSAFRPWVVDMWRDRTSSDRWIPPLIELMQEYKPALWLEEKGVIEKSVGPAIDQEQLESGAWTPRDALTSAVDKPTRARAWQWMMERYGLWFDTHCPFYSVIVGELLSFPLGKNDDIVDCFSLFGRKASEIRAGAQLKPQARYRPPGSMTLDEAIAREDRINRRRDGQRDYA